MKLLNYLFNTPTFRHPYTSCIILAAGIGSRFGNENGTKQNVDVCGIPAVVRTAMAFQTSDLTDEIILVARHEEIALLNSYKEKYALTKVSSVVEGGATRDESSYLGFKAISKTCKYVAIHDAARCLITPEMIKDTYLAAYKYGAASSAEAVVDTVKRCNSEGFIEKTVDRNGLWLIKTPQVFKRSIYLVSAAVARKDGIKVTDDCMMAEYAGFSVKLVDNGRENIKLTTRDDLMLAEALTEKRFGKGDVTK